jgi:hypothetical protein
LEGEEEAEKREERWVEGRKRVKGTEAFTLKVMIMPRSKSTGLRGVGGEGGGRERFEEEIGRRREEDKGVREGGRRFFYLKSDDHAPWQK